VKWLAIVVGVFGVLALGGLVAVVLIERDPTPTDLRSCADDAGARRIAGANSLGPLRVDLLAHTLDASRPVELHNGYVATFLRPRDGSYLAVAVARGDQAGLPVIRTISTEPDILPLVAFAQGGNAEALAACVQEQR
jgi:hypothetical protein